jgi:hypothetical protein
MAELTAVLRGGSRDGESTRLDESVTTLRAVSLAPGLLDIYEATDEHVRRDAAEGEATVYAFVTQEPADELAPEMIHLPPAP